MSTIDRHRATPLPPITPPAVYEPRPGLMDPPPEEPGIGEMLGRLHLMMRGRYLLSSFLAILFAAGFGYGGYRLGERTYRSTGQLRIVPTLPRIMYETEDKGVMPMFDSFVQTQVSLMKTQRVIDNALADRRWVSPVARDDAFVANFIKRLTVTRDNELIAITYDDSDPAFAQMAVRTVIAAYRQLYVEEDSLGNGNLMNQLTTRQGVLNGDLLTARQQIRHLADTYNTDQLDSIFKDKQEDVRKAEAALAEAEQEQARYEEAVKSPGGLSVEALAKEDPALAELMAQQTRAKLDVEQAKAEYGPQNESVRRAMRAQQVIDRLIDERAEKDRQQDPASGGELSKKIADQVTTRTNALKLLQQELKSIGRDALDMADYQRQAADAQAKLNETKIRIEQVTTELPVLAGRITVISDGDRPLVPAKDTRKVFAGAGGLCGFTLPFGMALLLSSANRKYGTPVETRMSSITRDLILGALPTVDEGTFDPETSTLAAHCLHQVRTMLQIRCNGHAKAIAITSSKSGSGKTSVVLGLGVSYAMAGSKTLLIDLDLVGGGLTRRAEIQARARLGNLLIEQGLVTDEQLEHALALAKEKRIKLGEAFVEAGFLQAAQLDAILNDQKRSHAGLMEALYGKSLSDCVSSAGMSNLDILPLGSANPHDAATLSPSEIKSVIDEAKTLYDTILIDTGPVPGSLEASMVASMTDGILLVVARGEPRASAEGSIAHLRRIGGRVTGLVFNRAKPSDAGLIGGSMYSGGQSLRVPSDRHRPPTVAARQAASARFGPVGQAVLDLVPPEVN